MSFTYSRGPYQSSTAIPSSAFSKGDLLIYDSNSSLSRLADPGPSATASDIAGVAEADSVDSLNDQVPYTLALPETIFLASCESTGQFNPGDRVDVDYTDAQVATTFMVASSTNTPQVVVMPPGSERMVSSGLSFILVKFDEDHTHWG